MSNSGSPPAEPGVYLNEIMAVLPGGVSGRLFHPHYKDQIKAFINGEKKYWWFSDKAIQENIKPILLLQP